MNQDEISYIQTFADPPVAKAMEPEGVLILDPKYGAARSSFF